MNTQRINITLPENLLRELSFEIPAGKRSQFIAEAVSERLQRKTNTQNQLKKSLMQNKDFYHIVADEWKETEIIDWPE